MSDRIVYQHELRKPWQPPENQLAILQSTQLAQAQLQQLAQQIVAISALPEYLRELPEGCRIKERIKFTFTIED